MIRFKDYVSRNLSEASLPNINNTRKLSISILIPEVGAALYDWIQENKGAQFVLIGGLAFSHHAIPRSTQDIDVLFLNPGDIPNELTKFKKTRPHSFQHNKTHVEVETLTPNFLKMNPVLARQIYQHATVVEGVRVASPSGVVASKLKRLSSYDRGDIENLIKLYDIDLSPYKLPLDQLRKFESIKKKLNRSK